MVHLCVPTSPASILISRAWLTLNQAIVLSSHHFEEEHQLFDSIHGIMFIGTPHAGSDLSKFALALGYIIKASVVKSPNISNIAVLEKDSEVLAGIQDSFSTAITKRERLEKKRVEIHCCTEEHTVTGLGRVGVYLPWLSSSC